MFMSVAKKPESKAKSKPKPIGVVLALPRKHKGKISPAVIRAAVLQAIAERKAKG